MMKKNMEVWKGAGRKKMLKDELKEREERQRRDDERGADILEW
mgnify:CR=1 FL=1